MTHAVATQPCSFTSHLRYLRGSSWTKLQALCFHGKPLSVMEALAEVSFDFYKQTTVTHVYRCGTRKNHSCSQRNDLTVEVDDANYKHNLVFVSLKYYM